MTSAEVARRTGSAYDRFLTYADPAEYQLLVCDTKEFDPAGCNSQTAADAGVELVDRVLGPGHASQLSFTVVAIDSPTATPPRSTTLGALSAGPGERVFGARPIVVAGRLADAASPTEVTINEWYASAHHLRPGSSITVHAFSPDQIDNAGDSVAPSGPTFEATVVGVVRVPDELRPLRNDGGVRSIYDSNNGRLYFGAGWNALFGADVATYGRGVMVNSSNGQADADRLQQEAKRAFGDARYHSISPLDSAELSIHQVTRLQERSVWIVASISLVAGLLFIAQALGRQLTRELSDHRTLAALGLSRRSAVAVGVGRGSAIAAGAAAAAVIVTVLASPIGPIGTARRGEISPGVQFDWPVLLIGGALVVVVVLGVCAATAWWTTRALTRSVASARPAGRWSRGLPLTGHAGLAIGRGGRDGIAATGRTAAFGSAIALTAGLVAATLIGSLGPLRSHAERFGQTWDARVGNAASAEGAANDRRRVLAEPGVTDAAVMSGAPVDVSGRQVWAFGFESLKGDLGPPPPLAGRLPNADDEVAVGLRILRSLDLSVGDKLVGVTSPVDGSDVPPLKIVGVVALPSGMRETTESGKVGDGLLLTIGAFRKHLGDANNQAGLVRFNRAMPRDDVLRRLEADFPGGIVMTVPPEDIENLSRIRRTPVVLAGLIGAMAVAALAHALLTAVRRRRREFGVLRALGFTRGQVSSAVAWHATLLVGGAVLVAVPLGIVAGRWAWRVVTAQLAVESAPVVPWIPLVLCVVGWLASANLVALIPGRSVTRVEVADALRAD